MRRILNRNQFLKYSLNEALANDVNWGDSLLGRLINSTIRKAGIGINLRKMDNVIKELQEQFDKLVAQIQVKNDESTEVITFYLLISALLGKLIEEIEDDSNSISDLIKSVEGTIYSITFDIESPNEETKKEKDLVLKKLEEYKEFLKSEDKEKKDKEKKDEEEEKNKKKGLDKKNGSEDKDKKNGDEVELPEYDLNLKSLNVSKSFDSFDEFIKLPELSEILSIDLTKKDVTEFISIINKINYTLCVIVNSVMLIKVSGKDNKTIDKSKIKELYRKIIKFVHSDKVNYTGLSEEDSKRLTQKVNELYKNNDFDGLIEFSKYLEELIKINKKKKQAYKIVDDKNKRNNVLSLSDGSERNKEVRNESLILRYSSFINENKDLSVEKLRGKFDEIFDEDFMKKYQVTKSPEELEKEIKSDKNTITIDPIIEIVKIFNRAYKLHTPGMIPSGRKSGKVSNSVFREYDYVGKGSDSARPASDGGVEPGVGPYRNKSIFNKWEKAVLDIIKNPEYQQIFNEDTYFQFKPSDPRYNKEKSGKEGGGKSLLKFMNEMIDGSELYREGAQSKFIKEYFDVEVDDDELGYKSNGKNDKDTVEEVAGKVKDKTNLTFKPYSKNFKTSFEMNNSYFKMFDENKNEWYFKIIKEKDDVVYFIMTLGYPFNISIENKFKKFNTSGKLYIGYSNFKDFEKGKIKDKKLIILEDKKVNDLPDSDKRFNFSEKIELLFDKNDKPYKNDNLTLMKGLEYKSRYLNKNLDDIIDRLKGL